jgi:hypothetical protein
MRWSRRRPKRRCGCDLCRFGYIPCPNTAESLAYRNGLRQALDWVTPTTERGVADYKRLRELQVDGPKLTAGDMSGDEPNWRDDCC